MATLHEAGLGSLTNSLNNIQMVMRRSQVYSLESILSSTPGRIGLVFLTVIVSSSVFSVIFWLWSGLSVTPLTILILTLFGLVAGISARALLRKNTSLLRNLTALTSVFIGLFVFGVFTRGVIGFSPFTIGISSTNWLVILEVVWCGSLTWLSVQAWHKPDKGDKGRLKTARRSNKNDRIPALLKNLQFLKIQRREKEVTSVQKPKHWPYMKKRLSSMAQYLEIKSNDLKRWISKKLLKPSFTVKLNSSFPKLKPERLKLQKSNRGELIKLIGEETHNCPYCLEQVSRNDSRGLKICTICKTWHHRDCWDETGDCQVPHKH